MQWQKTATYKNIESQCIILALKQNKMTNT